MKKIFTISIVITLILSLVVLVVGCQEEPSPQPTPTPVPAPEPTISAEPETVPTPAPAPTPEPTPAPPVTEELSFSLEVPPIEVAAGENQQLEVVATDEHGERLSDFDTAWIVSDENAGSITETGRFTAGEVVGSFADAVEVKVTKGDLIRTAVATITILPGSLEHVGIAPNPAEIGIEMTQQFVAVGADRYGNRISNLVFTWSVENGGGTIDEAGFFTAGATSGNYTDTVKVEATPVSGTRSATANVTVEPDRILFISGEPNKRRDIYIIDADGSNVRNLVSIKVKELKFSCSPDGRRIVYDAGDTYGKIMVMSTDGSGKLCLLENDSDIRHIFPAWSPDGARLVFYSYNNISQDTKIYLIDADGGNLTQLTDTSDFSEGSPDWSPDGTRIMYRLRGETWVMNADGSDQKRLLSITARSRKWSPDSTQVVFSSKSSKEDYSDIYVIDADGGNLTQLTDTSDFSEGSPDWSPDGTRIIYSVEGEIWVMNADGSNQKRLLIKAYSLEWSRDSTQIVFSSGSAKGFDSDIYVIDADSGNLTQLTDTRDYDESSPTWSPDGTQIVFSSYSHKEEKSDIYVIDADGSNKRKLTRSKDMIAYSRPAWSPDGSKIVFVSNEYKMVIEHSYFHSDIGMVTTWEKQHWRDEIWVMNADGSHKTCLTDNSYPVISSPRWLPRKRGVEVTEDSVIIPTPAP